MSDITPSSSNVFADLGLDNPEQLLAESYLRHIRSALAAHMGSVNAADAWLDSRDTGYPTTARDAIREGRGLDVLGDLEGQWGPGPHYS